MGAFTILSIVGYVIFSVILNGYIFSILWKWFMVTSFNLPILSVVNAIGIVAIIRFIVWKNEYEEEDNQPKDLGKKVAFGIIAPFLFLLFGYIIHLFQ